MADLGNCVKRHKRKEGVKIFHGEASAQVVFLYRNSQGGLFRILEFDGRVHNEPINFDHSYPFVIGEVYVQKESKQPNSYDAISVAYRFPRDYKFDDIR